MLFFTSLANPVNVCAHSKVKCKYGQQKLQAKCRTPTKMNVLRSYITPSRSFNNEKNRVCFAIEIRFGVCAQQTVPKCVAGKLKCSDGDITWFWSGFVFANGTHTHTDIHTMRCWTMSILFRFMNANVECARMVDNFMMAIEKLYAYIPELKWHFLTICNAYAGRIGNS